MKPSRITYINLSDIEERIQGYEAKYERSSAEFLQNKSTVPEDVALRWEAYLSQLASLRAHHDDIRSSYLGQVQKVKKAKTKAEIFNADAELAA